jgi:hypothetical protein
LANVFKYLELAIAKRGKQVFKLANWQDNFGIGIVKGSGCGVFGAFLPSKFDLRHYLA